MGRLILLRQPPGLVTSLSLSGVDSATATEAYSLQQSGSWTASRWFNSSEADSGISNSDNLTSWDGSPAFGYLGDVEGFRSHAGGSPTPGGGGDIRVFTGAYNASGNLQYTAGKAGSIFYQYIIPSNTSESNAHGMDNPLVKRVDGSGSMAAWGNGAPYAFCHGALTGSNSNFMADMDFVRGVSQFYVRIRRWFPSDYTFGGEKTMTINPPNWGGNAGIIWGGMGINIGGSQNTTGNLGFVLNGVDVLYNNLITLQRDHVYEIQLYMNRTGANGSHILKIWANDLGTPGNISLPSGNNMTIRLNVTNATIIPTTGSHTQFGNMWPENWSNPVSLCADPGSMYTNILARETNGGSGGNSPLLCRAA